MVSKAKYISDKISNEDIKSWKINDIITVKAGTGAGKSTFIKEKLYNYASKNNMKILMLVSRKQVIKDFEKDIEGKSNITIDTYQQIEQSLVHGVGYNLSKYDYIVCDEFHYFLSDDFNKWIDLSFDKIMSSKNNIKIMMSATGDSVVRYFKEQGINTINYGLPVRFDNIRNLRFYYEKETLEGFIEKAIKNNQKAIFFIESAEKACELHRKYPKHTMFNCSSNSKYYKYVNKNKVNKMLKHNKFDDLILITTRVMDTGVSINDPDLHKLVVDVIDAANIIQCIGRKRMMSDRDFIDVYITGRRGWEVRRFRDKVTSIKNKLDTLDFNGDFTYLKENPRDDIRTNLIYTEWDKEENQAVHRVHKLNYFKNKLDLEALKKMEDVGYNHYISEVLHKSGDYQIVESEQDKKALSIYLDTVIEKQLFKDEQEELKEAFKGNGLKARSLGINTLNGYLKDNELNYVIVKNRDKRRTLKNGKDNPYRDKTYWKVTEGTI